MALDTLGVSHLKTETTMQLVTRYRRLALAVAIVAISVASAIAFAFTSLLADTNTAGFAPALAVVAIWILLAVVTVRPAWHGLALRRLAKQHPEGLVFLAERQATLAPDLPAYMAAKGYTADVSQGWFAALVDDRGITAWSSGPTPKQLLLMPWDELGAIAALEFTTVDGRSSRGISVDVAPYATPLVVTVGFAAFGVQTTFGPRGIAEVVAATNALRPPLNPS